MAVLNRYSSRITQPRSQGASQAMLLGTGLQSADLDKPQVGIGSMWYDGNTCNMHLDRLAAKVREGVVAAGMVGMRFNTIGVSDGISMGTAVRRAVVETGNAVVIGGVVLSVGFAAVMASTVPTLAGFGQLACAAVVAATVAELMFLPALLVVTDGIVQRWRPAFRDRIFGSRNRPTVDGHPATVDAA